MASPEETAAHQHYSHRDRSSTEDGRQPARGHHEGGNDPDRQPRYHQYKKGDNKEALSRFFREFQGRQVGPVKILLKNQERPVREPVGYFKRILRSSPTQ